MNTTTQLSQDYSERANVSGDVDPIHRRQGIVRGSVNSLLLATTHRYNLREVEKVSTTAGQIITEAASAEADVVTANPLFTDTNDASQPSADVIEMRRRQVASVFEQEAA